MSPETLTIPEDVLATLAALDKDTLRRVFEIVLRRVAGTEHKLTTAPKSPLKWVETTTTPGPRPTVRGLSPSRPHPEPTSFNLREPK